MKAEAIQSDLLKAAGIAHGFFTRRGGVSEGVYDLLNGGVGSKDDPARVNENRRRMAEALGIAGDHLLVPFQVHSAIALQVDAPFAQEERPRCDGLVTATRGLGLGVTGADCGIILFADAERQIIGAAHAGWKGALTGVLEATIDAMETKGARRDSHQRRAWPDDRAGLLRSRPGIFRALSRCRARLCAIFQALGARRPFHVRSAALHRRAREERRNWPVRELRRRHLCRRGALFLLPPLRASQRAGLWPSHCCNRACLACRRERARRFDGVNATAQPPARSTAAARSIATAGEWRLTCRARNKDCFPRQPLSALP